MADGASERRRPAQRPPAPPKWRVEGQADEAPGRRFRPRGRFLALMAGLLLLNWVVGQSVLSTPDRLTVSYDEFITQLEAGNVKELNTQNDRGEGTFKEPVTVDKKTDDSFKVILPRYSLNGNTLEDRLFDKEVRQNAKSVDQPPPVWQQILVGFGPTLLLIGIIVWFWRRASSMGGGMLSGLGRSKAKRYDAAGEGRATFEDVAGIDEAEQELVEVVDFLRSPDKYRKLGAQIPRGVLLSGLPGTGKTLLARAVAGEADVPFFSLSASEFVEMIVGVGASRVRDLFAQAKAAAPAIIFIDELDAIGRARGSGMGFGGNDEREQTLNQILTEMDGFSGSEGVIVLAATNRPEILDPALMRAGRFDRRVAVNPPDALGRQQILTVHTRHMPLADDVDLASIASSTPGMVGADLKNLVNEAALMAARRDHERVQLADFTDSLEKLLLGAERKIVLSQADRERTAYHESGHALLGMLQPGADPVRKVSIVPRGRALGVTFQSPDNDQYGYSVDQLRGRIIGALGGRAAEKIIYDEITTGAESDLEQVTRMARLMVGRWGMSKAVGAVSVLPGPADEPMLFPGAPGTASEATRTLVDDEVRRIIEECEVEAVRLLSANRDKLDAMARTLLERETLDEEDAYRAAGITRAQG